MLNYSNPYNVLSETISFHNVQRIGELITLSAIRDQSAYAKSSLHWLYVALVKDLNRDNDTHHVFSDAYDLVQTIVCFLCKFVGKSLNDVYKVKNGKVITIKHATYMLVGRNIDRMRKHISRNRDINDSTEELSVEIDHSKRKNGKIEYKRIPIIDALRPYISAGIPILPSPQLIRRRISAVLPNHKLYDLRTTFYTRCDEYGVAEPARDEFVGHSAGVLTNTYRDLSDEYLLREGRKLNEWK